MEALVLVPVHLYARSIKLAEHADKVVERLAVVLGVKCGAPFARAQDLHNYGDIYIYIPIL